LAERIKEERYEEWLVRLDIPIEQAETIEDLRNMLKEILGWEPTEKQLEALWSARTTHIDLAAAGIHIVGTREAWGVNYRYGVQGLPGLWGWGKVREIMIGEGWWT